MLYTIWHYNCWECYHIYFAKSYNNDFEDITCERCRLRSQDLKQSLTTTDCTDGLSSDSQPCIPGNWSIPDSDQPPHSHDVVGGVEGKTWSFRDFATGATHLIRLCSCLLNNNNSNSIIINNNSSMSNYYCNHAVCSDTVHTIISSNITTF